MTMRLSQLLGPALAIVAAGAPASASAPAPAPAPASAPAPAQDPPPASISGPRRALAAGAAVVPGLLVHGAGHLVAGQTATGLRLLAIEGAGFGMLAGGLGLLAVTGASRRFAGPLVLMTATGGGLFLLSAVADLYGVLAPDGGLGAPPAAMPWVETQLGLRYVYDPTFSYRSFVAQAVDLRWRSLRLMPSAWFALDDANARIRVLGALRFFGPQASGGGAAARDGSFLELETAGTHHRYASDGFSITTGEVSLQGRLDLARLAPTLRGAFAEMGWGVALEAHRYHGIATEGNELLLARFAFGAYLGHEGYPRGEAALYYDHRHDGFAAGLKMTGLGSGVAGHFGMEGRLYLDPQWGLLLDAQVGSAYVAGLSVLFRHGGTP
jgi:hypothetical protein